MTRCAVPLSSSLRSFVLLLLRASPLSCFLSRGLSSRLKTVRCTGDPARAYSPSTYARVCPPAGRDDVPRRHEEDASSLLPPRRRGALPSPPFFLVFHRGSLRNTHVPLPRVVVPVSSDRPECTLVGSFLHVVSSSPFVSSFLAGVSTARFYRQRYILSGDDEYPHPWGEIVCKLRRSKFWKFL